MNIIEITSGNIDTEHICCAIGNDKENKARAHTKKEWLKDQFVHGLRFKRLDERGKVFIEYLPVEFVWKPIIGVNLMAINCLWVSGQYKGSGFSITLLNECIKDAKALNMNGLVVVSSSTVKPFLTDKKFYEKHGFISVDTALPYFELLALPFSSDIVFPFFSPQAKTGQCTIPSGFAFIYSNQCVFMDEYVGLLNAVAQSMNCKTTTIKLTSHEEAQRLGSPFGTLGIYYNGRFLTHELMTEAKFKVRVEQLLAGTF